MPTNNPRVNVTLSPSLDALVTQFAGIQRVSKSSVLREFLEAVEPSLRHALALMEAAKGASEAARKTVARDMQMIVQQAESTAHLALSVAADRTRDLVADAESIKGRRPKAVGKAAKSVRRGAPVSGDAAHAPGRRKMAVRPPSSNRGVK